jgi:hypothetical protein
MTRKAQSARHLAKEEPGLQLKLKAEKRRVQKVKA